MGSEGAQGTAQTRRYNTSSVSEKTSVTTGRTANPSDALHGMKDCYKIKLRGAGYRLVYRVEEERIVILVLAVGSMRTAKSSTQPCKAKTWCALTFKWAPVLAF